MYIPLIVLAALSVVGGFLGIPEILGGTDVLHHWLEPVIGAGEQMAVAHIGTINDSMELPLTIVSVVVAVTGILLATKYYKRKTTLAENERKIGGFYKLAFNKFYVDEIYDATVVKPVYSISNSFLYKITDVKIIDGIVNGSAAVTGFFSGIFRRLQTGIVQNYAVMIVVGIVILISYVIIF
jgi:NADH-quinone oxidoreductase subunit L